MRLFRIYYIDVHGSNLGSLVLAKDECQAKKVLEVENQVREYRAIVEIDRNEVMVLT